MKNITKDDVGGNGESKILISTITSFWHGS